MTEEQKKQISVLLNEIGKALDVTKTEYDQITTSYKAVGSYLADYPSPLSVYSPQIRPQGSFLFGTAVRPVSEEADLDIDLVCELTKKPSYWTQYSTKKAVGDRLKDSDRYRNMLDKEGKRCWTLKYADGKYHMDVLPCIVNEGYTTALERMLASSDSVVSDTTAIRITDKTRPDYMIETDSDKWQKSNPFALAKWFYNIAYRPTNLQRTINLKEAIAPVPKYYEAKAPLQRVVQLMKRHRDIMFDGNEDDKPISIIITTLAARAYNDETGLLSALHHIARTMTSYIEGTPGNRVVRNPVNPSENFADRWKPENKKEENFYKWVNKLQADVDKLIDTIGKGQDKLYSLFEAMFGEKVSKASFKAVGLHTLDQRKAGTLTAAAGAATLGTGSGTTVAAHNFYGKQE